MIILGEEKHETKKLKKTLVLTPKMDFQRSNVEFSSRFSQALSNCFTGGGYLTRRLLKPYIAL